MDIVMKTLLALLGASLFGMILLQQRAQFHSAQERAEQAEQQLMQQQAQLLSLQTIVHANQQLLTTLQHKQRQIHATLTQRERHLEQLIQHNPTLRAWGDTALPDAIIELRRHAIFASANTDLERLPTRSTVPTAELCTEDESGTLKNVGSNGSSVGRMCRPD